MDFVEEERAPARELEQAAFALARVGKCAALVSEELRLEQVLGDRRAVDCDERLLRIRAGIVNTAREQLFSGAGFAQQQHRRARRARDAMSQGEGLGNRRAAPEDVLKAKVGRQRRV